MMIKILMSALIGLSVLAASCRSFADVGS